jgi:hypothetical protein
MSASVLVVVWVLVAPRGGGARRARPRPQDASRVPTDVAPHGAPVRALAREAQGMRRAIGLGAAAARRPPRRRTRARAGLACGLLEGGAEVATPGAVPAGAARTEDTMTMHTKEWVPLGAALALALPSVASADPLSALRDVGTSVTVGGGVTGFTDGDTRDAITVGGAWEARFAAGTKRRLAIEGAYVGSAQPLDVLGVNEDAVLLGTGLEATARLNILLGDVQPYLVAGAGWTRYDVTNTDTNTSDVADEDDVLAIPLGVGLGYRYQHLLVDARATYRPVSDADLMATADDDGGTLDTWTASLRAGFEF